MKTLLTEKSIRDLIAQGATSVCIDENTIVTPAARDAIKYNGLEVTDCTAAPTATATYSACIPAPTPAPAAAPAGGDALSTEMIYNALKKMTEQGLLNGCFEAPASAEAPQKQPLIRLKTQLVSSSSAAAESKWKFWNWKTLLTTARYSIRN